MRMYRNTLVTAALLAAVMTTAPPAQASVKQNDQPPQQVKELASAMLPTFLVGNAEVPNIVWLANDPAAGSAVRTMQVGMQNAKNSPSPDNSPMLGKEVWAISASRTARIAPASFIADMTVDFGGSVLLSPSARASPSTSRLSNTDYASTMRFLKHATTGASHVRRELTR